MSYPRSSPSASSRAGATSTLSSTSASGGGHVGYSQRPNPTEAGTRSEEEDDLYAFEVAPTDLMQQTFGATGSSGAGMGPMPPGTALYNGAGTGTGAMRPPTSMLMHTSVGYGGDAPPGLARPMTSVKGAGYTSSQRPRTVFDPLNTNQPGSAAGAGDGSIAAAGAASGVLQRPERSVAMQARELERDVHRLLEQSAVEGAAKKWSSALDKAKEAGRKERLLAKLRAALQPDEGVGSDLTFAVCFNLALQYQNSGMLQEALNTYTVIVKNKSYQSSGRLRANMGNIYFAQKKYPAAIKMYRMAMDQIGANSKEMR